MNTPKTTQDPSDHLDNDKEELRLKLLAEISDYSDSNNNEAGHHNAVYASKELLKIVDQYTQSKLKAFAGEFEKAIGEEIMCYDSTDISHKFMSCDTCQSNMKNYELRQALKAIKGKAGIE